MERTRHTGRRTRTRTFAPLAAVRATELDLPSERLRELDLGLAWARVAGAAMAARVRPRGVRRGTLELLVPSGPWFEAVAALIPSLAARLAAHHPSLGIRRFRLVHAEGQASRPEPVAVHPAPPDSEAARQAAPLVPPRREAASEHRAIDVADVARRYLARSVERGTGGEPSA